MTPVIRSVILFWFSQFFKRTFLNAFMFLSFIIILSRLLHTIPWKEEQIFYNEINKFLGRHACMTHFSFFSLSNSLILMSHAQVFSLLDKNYCKITSNITNCYFDSAYMLKMLSLPPFLSLSYFSFKRLT